MTSTDNVTNALMVVLALNLLMFMVGGAISDVTGAGVFNNSDNVLNTFRANGTAYDVPSDVGGYLPSGEATTVSVDTGLAYTDMFTSIKTWFVDVTGLGFVLTILSGPKVILSAMLVPEAIAWAITAWWYGITVFLIVAFFWGR